MYFIYCLIYCTRAGALYELNNWQDLDYLAKGPGNVRSDDLARAGISQILDLAMVRPKALLG
jgi:hypothetical protein